MDDLPRTTWPTRRTPILALLGANAISETGNVVAFVAIPWFVLQTTGSAAKTGLTGGAFLLAAVVAGVVVGPVVDRLGFKRASIVADLAGAVTVALIPLIYHTIGLIFWQLLVLVFLGGFLTHRATRPVRASSLTSLGGPGCGSNGLTRPSRVSSTPLSCLVRCLQAF